MLLAVREKSIALFDGMTVEDLDHHHDALSNSIGMLLGHFVALDLVFIARVLESRRVERSELGKWESGLQLRTFGRSSLKGRSPEVYREALIASRGKLLLALEGRDDQWLDQLASFLPYANQGAKNRFLVFHQIEDELRHQGQIIWQRNRLPHFTRLLDERGELNSVSAGASSKCDVRP